MGTPQDIDTVVEQIRAAPANEGCLILRDYLANNFAIYTASEEETTATIKFMELFAQLIRRKEV